MATTPTDEKKLTVIRALAELNLLDKRINSRVSESKFAACVRTNSVPAGYASKEEFVKLAAADMQSVQDLIERRDLIKAAIVQSNATTKVTVAGKEMTVAAAIEKKNSISYMKAYLQALVAQYIKATSAMDKNNSKVSDLASKQAESILGDGAKKNLGEEYTKLVDAYIKHNEYVLVTPPALEATIKKISKEIEDFESEVNFILAESNTITYIDIEG